MDTTRIVLPMPAFLQAALDALDAHLAILDGSGEIVAVNAAWRQFGMENGWEESSSGIGSNYLKVCETACGAEKEEANLIAERLKRVLEGELQSFEWEYPCHSPQERRWFMLRAIAFCAEGQRWAAISHESVTPRKYMEEQLSLIRRAVEDTQEGITIADFQRPDRPIIYANGAFTRITGYEAEEVIGKNCRFLQGDETASEAVEEIRAALREERPCRVELLNYRKDGTPFWNQLSLGPLKNEQGQITHYVGVQMEITEKKSLEEELKMLNANKDKLFSVISHDLKSPFHSILGFSEILSGDLQGFTPDELRSYAEHIHTGARNLLNLIENLMQWTRLQSGKLGYAPEPLGMTDLVENTFELVRGNAMRKGIALRHDVPRNLRIFADSTMMSLVLQNLLTNAVKFTHTGGCVAVEAWMEGRDVLVQIQDEGVGMTPEQQAHLFRLDQTGTTLGTANEKGTGLGLILCKELMELQYGALHLQSAPGQGTKVTLSLPSERPHLS